jgi:hypothetical protein
MRVASDRKARWAFIFCPLLIVWLERASRRRRSRAMSSSRELSRRLSSRTVMTAASAVMTRARKGASCFHLALPAAERCRLTDGIA